MKGAGKMKQYLPACFDISSGGEAAAAPWFLCASAMYVGWIGGVGWPCTAS